MRSTSGTARSRPLELTALAAVIALAAGTISAAPAAAAGIRLIDTAATQWSYLADNTDPAADADPLAWTATGYDDSAWPVAAGGFGAKNGTATGMGGGYAVDTLLPQYIDGAAPPNVPAYFFRTSFDLTADQLAATETLTASAVFDDAMTVYLNGARVAGFEDGAITGNLVYGGDNGGDPDLATFPVSTEPLREGSNTLAVVVHQVNATSSDVYFDFLSLDAAGDEPPAEPLEPIDPALVDTGTNGLRGDYSTVGAGPEWAFDPPAASSLEGEISYRDLIPVYDERLGRNQNVGVSWTGAITAPASGDYTFFATGDNGMRLSVGGRQIIDFWVNQFDLEQTSTTVRLEAGERYAFRFDTFQAGGGANAFLRWSGPGIERSFVPLDALNPPAGFAPVPASASVDATGALVTVDLRGTVSGASDAGVRLIVDGRVVPVASVTADGERLILAPEATILAGSSVRVEYDGSGPTTVDGSALPAFGLPVVNGSRAVDRDVSLNIGPDETTRNLAWVSDGPNASDGSGAEAVQFAPASDTFPAGATTVVAASGAALYERTHHRATISGLAPDTRYLYRVGSDDAGWSGPFEFATDDLTGDFDFIVAGDAQIGASGDVAADAAGWADTLAKAGAAFPETDFIYSVGDQVETHRTENEYDGFLAPPQLRSIPLATTIGNHDNRSIYYREQYNMPNIDEERGEAPAGESGGDYWFMYQDVLYLNLNSNNRDTADHTAFLERVIGEHGDEARWTVVTWHHSVFSVALHATDTDIIERRAELPPVMSRLGVDLVLMGHDHAYTRSHLMNGSSPAGDDADREVSGTVVPGEGDVLYLTANSSSGSKYYDIQEDIDFDWDAVPNQEYVPNITDVAVTDESITLTTYRTTDMSVVDEVRLENADAEPAEITAGTPTIVGSPAVGATLRANAGQWAPGDVVFSYQWAANGAPIAGATGSTYEVSRADRNARITVTVTGSKPGYAPVTVTSAPTARVGLGSLMSPVPRVEGTASVGETLTAVAGTWTAGTRLSYQWSSDGRVIRGATGSTYEVENRDRGRRLTVTVTGSQPGYGTVSVTSARTRVVTATKRDNAAVSRNSAAVLAPR